MVETQSYTADKICVALMLLGCEAMMKSISSSISITPAEKPLLAYRFLTSEKYVGMEAMPACLPDTKSKLFNPLDIAVSEALATSSDVNGLSLSSTPRKGSPFNSMSKSLLCREDAPD